ncbi:uncharacterized protein LOC131228160 isoform X2 [Magnolia sinica]|uniref:uncharacterized protein LOC131228160 isoform X2 n=1 Tax=Magnolia sinica TaxID=86752 RepID=UPI0026587228|nr:uncharacterized protein LOC131228160 isoform X2 [Magnolia sinica]
MPGLAQKNAEFCNSPLSSVGSVSANGIWSKHRADITFDQLQKFWSELSPHARQELLKIDKQTLFEQARKNLYCSRCNGLLLEGFSQIVMYGKSLQQEGACVLLTSNPRASKNQIENGLDMMSSSRQDDAQDPSVHPWGGLAATRDGILTLLDCFLDGKSLIALQNVFDSARAREHERELLYPDACGGSGRGWISQGMVNYGRGYGTRETCALHTVRLSCDTLVDFWSALGDETRQSLLRMKEEDFIERLMYRDCRRNVIREFKELKELKRMRREPRCTNWFCVADTAFQYEVSDDTVQADWHQSFTDAAGAYHHFEWAVGTGEGQSDILEFEDVGMTGSVQVNGLDLGDLTSCFITLRAWRLDGRCTELTVKAHALKGQPCVHRRLIVGDGFVTITKGESIRRFFEHAEEAEEDEDDDSMDKDGNELDGDGSRPQKHAKSPELAREFLLDAATVIFKEQVEKAFREGTARQNAHSIFVCLALKLLEERVHVACKEIITLEMQIKLLEEEEKEKREEEERKERRRIKEREKKLRRKERLKGKERERERNCSESKQLPNALRESAKELSLNNHEEAHTTLYSGDMNSAGRDITVASTCSSDVVDEEPSNGCTDSKPKNLNDESLQHPCSFGGEINAKDVNSFTIEQSKASRRKSRFRKDSPLEQASRWRDRRRSAVGNDYTAQLDESEPKVRGYMATSRCVNGPNRQSRNGTVKTNARNCSMKFGDKLQCSNNRIRYRYGVHSCSCNLHTDYRGKEGHHVSMIRSSKDFRTPNKPESSLERPFYRSSKYNHGCYMSDSCGIPKVKLLTGNLQSIKGDVLHTKKVWEPMESRKNCPRSNSNPDITLRSPTFKVDACKGGMDDGNENGHNPRGNACMSFDEQLLSDFSGNSGKGDALNGRKTSNRSNPGMQNGFKNGFCLGMESLYCSIDAADDCGSCHVISTLAVNNASDPSMSNSSSDNYSSCLSEGDSCTGSSGAQNAESLLMSDSEDASLQSEGKEIACSGSAPIDCRGLGMDEKNKTGGQKSLTSGMGAGFRAEARCMVPGNFQGDPPTKDVHHCDNGRIMVNMGSQQHHVLPMQNQCIHLPVFGAPMPMNYYHQSAAAWAAAPTNELVPFHQPSHYLYTSPLDYRLSANQSSHFCAQYGPLQPLTNHHTPVVTVGQLPLYQMENKANIVDPKDDTKNCTPGGAREAVGVADTALAECRQPLERPFRNRRIPQEEPSCGQDGNVRDLLKSHNEGPTFSLFHFGGPVAVGAGFCLNQVSLKNEAAGNSSSKPPAAPVQGEFACSEMDTSVEEYSLFAARNRSHFSFF